MWCPLCQSDVATEVAADGQSLLCTTCGTEIRKVFAPSLHPQTRSARSLLDRWAAEDLLETPSASSPPPEKTEPAAEPRASRTTAESIPAPPPEKPKPKIRIDAAHPPSERPRHAEAESRAPRTRPAAAAKRSHELPPGHRQDAPHETLQAPHFDLQKVIKPADRPGRGESLWGQLLAYAGVGVMTIGTVLVLWGHFGAMANYASTGWLVATAGQMLLFLGVITLVSGGMQQTTHEVSQRVEHIGERIIRIEQSTRDLLRGPHFGSSGSRSSHAAAADDDVGREAV